MGIYKMGNTSKMSNGSKGVSYSMGKSMDRTAMSKVKLGKGEGNKLSHRSGVDPKGAKCK